RVGEQPAGRVGRRDDVRQAHGRALRGIGVLGAAGPRTRDIGEDEHVARLQLRVIAREGCGRRTAWEAAAVVSPRPEGEALVVVATGRAPAGGGRRGRGPRCWSVGGVSGTRVGSRVPASRGTAEPVTKTRAQTRAFVPSCTV